MFIKCIILLVEGEIMKIAILFGGASTEHNVSVVSGTSVISNLDKNKYDIYPVYIDKDNNFYEYNIDLNNIKILGINDEITNIKKIDNIIEYLKKMDVVFPVLHGKNGEDGTIQGLLEIINVPYVGCKVLSSSICMDKVYTKKLLESCNIKITKYMYIKKINNKYIYFDNEFNEYILNEEELIKKTDEYLSFPVFVKPSRSGSSVGAHESNKDDFIKNINDAFSYDSKVLIEEKIEGRELEVAVLGNNNLDVSLSGEINNNTFYSYESKYIDKTGTIIPAKISDELHSIIRSVAYKAYKVCDCSGLSRIDFFLDKNNNLILNEINTMPGFTDISMYPKLMSEYGYSYSKLLDKLIELALKSVD